MSRESSPFVFHTQALYRAVLDATREQGLTPDLVVGIVMSKVSKELAAILAREQAQATEDYEPDDMGGDDVA
jgi:ABC-type sugar transport system substrate-binding protein